MLTCVCVIAQKEFLQGQVGSSLHSFDLGRMTDLSLALYQDSGWYDVKVCTLPCRFAAAFACTRARL